MIKIEKISPLGGDKVIKLTDLGPEHAGRIKRYSRTFLRLKKAYQDDQYTLKKEPIDLTKAQKAFIEPFTTDAGFAKLVTAPTDELERKYIQAVDMSLCYNFTTQEPTPFGKFLFQAFAYDGFRAHEEKGLWLARQLNIKACPYCNAQYTLTTTSTAGKSRARFQFDHFFPKSIYPHLSVSLFNLVPSCANCNLIKSDKPVTLADSFHPYHFDLSAVSAFRLKPTAKYTLPKNVKEEDLEIEFTATASGYQKFVKEHEASFELNAIYDRHRDVAKDLVVQSVVHNSAFKADLMKIKGLFDGDERMYRRFVLGNYGFEDEVPNQPLVKMTRDIAKKLKLIDD